MAGSTKKTPVKGKQTATARAVKAAAEKEAQQAPVMVAPLHPDAFRLAMTIVNRADVKGGDAETIVLLKRELARVVRQRLGTDSRLEEAVKGVQSGQGDPYSAAEAIFETLELAE